jgi:hypothetical protein
MADDFRLHSGQPTTGVGDDAIETQAVGGRNGIERGEQAPGKARGLDKRAIVDELCPVRGLLPCQDDHHVHIGPDWHFIVVLQMDSRAAEVRADKARLPGGVPLDPVDGGRSGRGNSHQESPPHGGK